jgi:hypothetical protein
MSPTNNINPQGRLDIAASRIVGRLIFHKANEIGLGDLAEGIVELATPFLQTIFADLFGNKPITLPEKLVNGVTQRLTNGMDSKVKQSIETDK